MFGLIVSGRPITTDYVQVDQTHIVFSIPEAEKINHIVTFMTGQQAFPDGVCGAVYFGWLGSTGEPLSWQFLGIMSNDKPSAIFRISKLMNIGTGDAENQQNGLVPLPSHVFASVNQSHFIESHHNAFVGISVEPLSAVQGLLPDPSVVPSSNDSFQDFVNKMVENFVNYIGSFSLTQSQMTANPTETYVPASAIQRWYENFQRKLAFNPTFWKT